MKRTLRHPIRGDRLHPKPSTRPSRRSHVARRAPRAADAAAQERQRRLHRRLARGGGVPARICACASSGSSCSLLFGVLVLRLWTLQVVEGKSYAAAVTRNQVRVVSIAAPRGEIVDRNGTVLVSNTPQQEILLSRAEATQNPAIVGMVAALVGQTPKQVQASINNKQYSPYEPVPVAVGVSARPRCSTCRRTSREYPGVTRRRRWRSAPTPRAGRRRTHVLGYIGDISSSYLAAHPNDGYTQGSQIGVSGIEAQYEPYLQGRRRAPGALGRRRRQRRGHPQHHRTPDRRHRRAQHRHRAATGGPERPAAADPGRPAARSTRSTTGSRRPTNGAVDRDEPPERPGAARWPPSRPTTSTSGWAASRRPTSPRCRRRAPRTTTPSRVCTRPARPSSSSRRPPPSRTASDHPDHALRRHGHASRSRAARRRA